VILAHERQQQQQSLEKEGTKKLDHQHRRLKLFCNERAANCKLPKIMNQKSSNIFRSFFYTYSETETGCKKTLKTTTIPIQCGLKIDPKKKSQKLHS
jgi:hypothetical protein